MDLPGTVERYPDGPVRVHRQPVRVGRHAGGFVLFVVVPGAGRGVVVDNRRHEGAAIVQAVRRGPVEDRDLSRGGVVVIRERTVRGPRDAVGDRDVLEHRFPVQVR